MAIALTVAAVAGCNKAGKSIVQVQKIELASSLTGQVQFVAIAVEQGTKEIKRASFPFSMPMDLGVYLPSDVEGNVAVRAIGYSGPGTTQGQNSVSARVTVSIKPGEVTLVATLLLNPGTDGPPTNGTGGTGVGSGGTGTGGAGGLGGSAGVTATGGSTATGGGTATGGRAATGGATASGGSVGTGGTVGTGGRVGTGGSVSTGGTGTGTGGAAGPGWGSAVKPDPNSLVTDLYPRVAVDAQGNAVVIYIHGSSIWANKYTFATNTWGTPGAVDPRPSGTIAPQSPTIAVATVGAGGATQWLAVWQQDYSSATLHGIWQSTSTDGITWTAPTAITTATLSFEPVLAMNRTGMAVVAWTDTTGAAFTLMGSVRPAGGAWTAPHVMHPPRDNGEHIPTVAVSGLGDAFVAWEQADDSAADQTSVWAGRYAAGTGWTPEMLMESYDAYGAYSTGIAANLSGQAILTWLQPTLATQQLWSRKYTPGTGWAAGVMVTEAGDIPYFPSPSVTLDDAGTGTIAFSVTVGNPTTGKNNVYIERAGWAQAWPPPMAIETDNAAPNDAATLIERTPWPIVAIDTAGNTALTWRKLVGTRFDLYGRRLTAAGVLGPQMLIGTQPPNGVFSPDLAVGPNGTGVVAWYYGNELKVWANVLR